MNLWGNSIKSMTYEFCFGHVQRFCKHKDCNHYITSATVCYSTAKTKTKKKAEA